MKNLAESNAALYNALNDIDDRRERGLKAASTCRHEPSSAYGGLYDVEEVDDGGRLVERRERGVVAPFIPVAELPEYLMDAEAPEADLVEPADVPPTASDDEPRIEEIRYLSSREGGMQVLLRRRSALRAL